MHDTANSNDKPRMMNCGEGERQVEAKWMAITGAAPRCRG